MPDQQPIQPGHTSEADRTAVVEYTDHPAWRYRVTAYYGRAVRPPVVHGGLAMQGVFADQVGADDAVADYTDRPDIDAVLVEQRLTDDVKVPGPREGWRSLRRWSRTDGGWTHS